MNKGIIAINKPKDWTSFDIVNKIKHMVKPNKVGHLGTLDPMATGVLLVTVGKATKLFDIMQQKQKTYVATFEFGKETDTLDATGKVVNSTENVPTKQQILDIIQGFIGKINQIPPMYSAKSVNGVRAYDLARKGETVELKPKEIEIFEIKLIDYSNNILKLEIVCGSGTYIRAIGRDIAYKLGSFATMTELTRTKIDNFDLTNCYEIAKIDKDNVYDFILPISKVLEYEKLNLIENDVFKILNGQIINVDVKNGNYFVISNEEIVAIAVVNNSKAKMSIFLGWFIA